MAIIPKGCTAINTFSFPYAEADTDVLFITYQQNGKTVIEKDKTQITWEQADEGYTLNVYLEQEDTIQLDSNAKIKMQIRAKLTSGTVIKSNVVVATTDEILKNEVI